VGNRSSHDGSLVSRGEWREFVLLSASGVSAQAAQRCPRTTQLLLTHAPAALSLARCGVGEALFSALTPGTRLRPHCGSTNSRLTCHLGLVTNPGCGLRVGDEVRRWEDGKCLVFDDSYEHEAWNDGDCTRIVLLLNFWHPDMPAAQRAALHHYHAADSAGAAPFRA
jgi:aspartate beta-hydroxylase